MNDDPDFRPPLKEAIAVLLMLAVSITTLLFGAFCSASIKAERQAAKQEQVK